MTRNKTGCIVKMKKRILFVDDETDVLDGLKRVLRRQRDVWEMVFVNSSAKALEKMAEAPFDVVVSDMLMPDITGLDLLDRIRRQYPRTARIILSGQVDDKDCDAVLDVAHQFLLKPTKTEDLEKAIDKACAVGQDQDPCQLVVDVSTLPSLPSLYVELTRAAASEECTTRDITAIIERDIAMTAKLLQLVNSAFFGQGRRVSSTEKAVSLLGVNKIKAIVLNDHIFTKLKITPGKLPFKIDCLWQHSINVANCARAISIDAKQTGDRPDQAFTAGMLHDIGILILASQHSDSFDELIRRHDEDHRPIHAIVGGHLLGLWGLPQRIIEAVTLHHNPSDLNYDGLCALTAVHVADAIMASIDEPFCTQIKDIEKPQLDMAYLERTKLAGRLEHWYALCESICAK